MNVETLPGKEKETYLYGVLMKRLPIILIAFLCLSSCTPSIPTVERKVPPPKEPIAIPVQTIKGLDKAEQDKGVSQDSGLLSKTVISTPSFNPQKGEELTIYYPLSRKSKVEVTIYDPDFTAIRTLNSKGFLKAGQHKFVWDGRDLDGKVVPDEAYFFTITTEDEKGNTEIYDPTVFSGGEGRDITEAHIDPDTKVITYRLPVVARVLIRLGVQDGPLLKTLVDWKPRVAGEITEYWNGRDQDNIIDLLNHLRFKMLITYFALPENSIITYGNRNINYREYKKSLKAQRPVKERTVRTDVLISPHYQLSRTVDYSPKLKLSFSNVKEYERGDIPVLQDKTLIKVEIDEPDKSFFVNQQYEITLFLDTEFYAEQEMGYVPFNWVWDLSGVNEGEHILTINMSGFKDQIGVLSKKVKVIN